MAAPPSKYLLVKASERPPVNKTRVPKIALKRGPAKIPYVEGVRAGIATLIIYF